MEFERLDNLVWLWLVAAVILAHLAGEWLRRRGLRRFVSLEVLGKVTTGTADRRRLVQTGIGVAVMGSLVLALADPRWGRTFRDVPRPRTQLVFLLDVSRSMLAQDASPSRLERAKLLINDVLDVLAGERAGLVAFAGTARQLVPLTTNYGDLRQALQAASPAGVDRGGSRLGDALAVAADAFLEKLEGEKFLFVLTDGEDQQSEPLAAAQALRRQGIRIVTVGVGDAEGGARIPIPGPSGRTVYVEDGGQTVWTKMNPALLEEVAGATDGFWVPAGTKQVDLGQFYTQRISPRGQDVAGRDRAHVLVSRFPWFVGAAFALLLLETLLPTGRPRSWRPGGGKRQPVAGLVLIGVLSGSAMAASPREMIRQSNEAYRAGRLDDALEGYRRAADVLPSRYEPIFNQGVIHYRRRQWDLARQRFTESLATDDRELEAKARFNLGNCDYAEALAGGSREAVVDKLHRAIQHYRKALALRPDWSKPRANIQLARMLLDRPPSPQSSDSSSDDGSKPNEQSGEPENPSEQQDEQQQNPPPGAGGQNRPQGDQEEPQPPPARPPESSQQGGRSPGNRAESSSAQQPNRGSGGGATGGSGSPAETGGETSQPRDSSSRASNQSESPETQPPRRQLTRGDIERMLQTIRDQQEQRQLDRAGKQAYGQPRVEKDW